MSMPVPLLAFKDARSPELQISRFQELFQNKAEATNLPQRAGMLHTDWSPKN